MGQSVRTAVQPSDACIALLIAALSGGCIIDEDARCSPGQLLEDGLCLCPAGATIVNNACVVSAIDAGSDDAATPPDAGLGAACGPELPCSDPAFARCQQAPQGAYCTATGCTSASDCSAGYQCDTTTSPSYCRRPYAGQSTPCATSSTCTGDATFCSGFLRMCLVPGCTEGDNGSCDPGFICFNAGMFMPGMPNVCVKRELLQP